MMSLRPNKLFCFGLGYSARNLMEHLRQQDTSWTFAGSCRKLPENPLPDVDYHLFDGETAMSNAREILSDMSHILISIPPQKNIGDPALHHHGQDISLVSNLKWLGYLSTTGVYGDRKGDWVDDETIPAPSSDRGQERLEAEQGWVNLFRNRNVPAHLFRLGSIYGPDKGQLANLKAGKLRKIVKEGQYFSRIHVDDIAETLIASMARPHPGQSYNLVDDLPTPSHEIIDYLCDILGLPHLPAIDINSAELSPMMRSFYSENKKVHNDRIKDELGVKLKYPTYKEGFRALIQT